MGKKLLIKKALKHRREYVRKYQQQPHVKERLKEYKKKYAQSPAGKERTKKYQQQPHVKEQRKEYKKKYAQSPAGKEQRKKYAKKYRQLPHVKKKHNEEQKKFYIRKKTKQNIDQVISGPFGTIIQKSTGGLIKPKLIKLAKRGWGKIIR